MVLKAFRGALGFLTTLPVGRTKVAWEAFADHPVVMVLVGYVLGGLIALPLLLPLPSPIVGFAFVLGIGIFAGLNNVDGLLDLADGVATHGTPEQARAAMKDSQIGVGAVLTMGVVLLGLFAVGFWFGTADLAALGVVVAAEVGAKLGMVAVATRGTATHDGLGSALAGQTDSWTIPVGLVLALPATVLTYPVPAATVAVAVALGGAFLVEGFARDRLGGINGDVLGATNEITRLGALLAGVIVWTLW